MYANLPPAAEMLCRAQARPMPTACRGFTLIELIIVIVILSILAATALPKFLDLRGAARDAALAAAVGALEAASNLNAAQWRATDGKRGVNTADSGCAALTHELMDDAFNQTWDSDFDANQTQDVPASAGYKLCYLRAMDASVDDSPYTHPVRISLVP